MIRKTDHLFLELPLLKEKLEEYINKATMDGGWSQNAIHATNSWLKEGLKARCITRDLKWGVPVPHDKYKDKVYDRQKNNNLLSLYKYISSFALFTNIGILRLV